MSEILKRLEGGYYGWRKWNVVKEWTTPTGEIGIYHPTAKDGIAREALISVFFDGISLVIQAHHRGAINAVLHDVSVIARVAGAKGVGQDE